MISSGVKQDHIIEIPFDSFENKEYRNSEILYPYLKSRIVDHQMYYFLFDEIQMLDHFEEILNSFLRYENVDIYVTGSNAKFLSKDIITEFRGRGDEIHMYPLSFSEFMSVYAGNKYDGWNEYILYGGLPLVINFHTDEEKVSFLKSIFEETYISDIVGRNKVRNQDELEDLLNILSSSIGSLTNPSKLSKTLKSVKNKAITVQTIKKYITYLEDSFLIDRAIRYDIKGRKYINTPCKYYFGDIGLRNVRLNFRQLEETHTMENVIFNELKLRGYNVDIDVVNQNIVNKNGNTIKKQLEIDFVCNKGSERIYIQSAFALPTQEKMEQEQRSLTLTQDFFKKIIITKDTGKPRYNELDIYIMNIYDFLLNPNSLEY